MNLRDEWRERVAEALPCTPRCYPATRSGHSNGCKVSRYATADALLAPGGVVAGIVAEALRAAADELPRRTEGADRAGTETWRTHDRDVYSLAIEEAQGALRACADKAAPDDPISTPVRRSEPLSGSGEGAGPSDGAEGVERGKG